MKHLLKKLTFLALALTMSIGAWAQGQLLTTISHDGNGDLLSGSRTFDGVATLTVVGNISYSSTDGWQTVYSNADGGLLTVTAADGYTIDSCRFIYGSKSYTAAAAPFACTPTPYLVHSRLLPTLLTNTRFILCPACRP